MNAKKTFDCVRMKRDLQEKLHKEWAGLTTEEIQAEIHKHVATSQSKLAKWWRRLQKAQARKDRTAT